MPPLALALLFYRALPWLSVDGRAVINTLVCDNGRVGSVQALCTRLGLRSRFQLNRLLRREGLPPYEELSGWVCVFYWMLKADGQGPHVGGALRVLASGAQLDVASCYRLVRRVTGRCWTNLRDGGTDAAVALFVRRTRPPRAHVSVRQSPREPVVMADPAPHNAPACQPRPLTYSRLALGGGPHGIAVRGRDLAYVTRPHAAAIERLDLSTGKLDGTIPLGCAPTCVSFHPSGNSAYVSVQYCDEIAVIDTRQHRQVGALRVPGDPFPLVVSRSGRTLFVTTNQDRLFSLCPSNGRIIGSLQLPATSHHIALHPAGGRIYVATRAAGSVLEVDTARCEVLRRFSLGGWPQGLVVSPEGTLLFCANEQHGIDVVQLATGRRIATLELEGPVSLALSPDHRSLYAGLVHAGKVCAIDATTFEVSDVLDTGGRPREIGFDVRGDRMIVANEAGWLDLLPRNGRGMYRLGALGQPQTPRVALSVS